MALAVLALLAALFPWELGEKADPFAPAFADIKPEWYFMFMFQTLKYVPCGEVVGIENEAIAILAFCVIGLAAFLVPFLDVGVRRRGRSPIVTLLGVVAVIFIIVMTAVGYHSWVPLAAGAAVIVIPCLVGRRMGRTGGRRS